MELKFWHQIRGVSYFALFIHFKPTKLIKFTDRWIPFSGSFPANAVEGGYEGEAKLFVGRRMHEGKFIIGKVVDSIKAIFLPYFWKELRFDDFEILVLE